MNQSLVPTLELCQKMKKLGWKKETTFYWRVEIDDGEEYPEVWFGDFEERLGLKKITSPTLQEILEELPMIIYCDGEPFGMFIGNRDNSYTNGKIDLGKKVYKFWYSDLLSDEVAKLDGNDIGFIDESPVNACAKMWIYLKENGLLEEKI